MKWTSADASRFTKKADTEDKRQMWARIANSIYDISRDERKAIRQANAAVRDYEILRGHYAET